MLYELEKIRNDRKYITSRLEENNRRLSELLQDEKVSEYLRIMKDSEILRSFLQINEANLRYSEMGKCEHIYVVTDEVEDDSYCDGVAKVYHCLKCGLTNEYEVKNIDVSSLDTDQLGMFRLFKESAFESFVIGDEIYSLELAKTIYQTITNENPNISNAELELRFLELYLQYTSGKQNEEKQEQSGPVKKLTPTIKKFIFPRR